MTLWVLHAAKDAVSRISEEKEFINASELFTFNKTSKCLNLKHHVFKTNNAFKNRIGSLFDRFGIFYEMYLFRYIYMCSASLHNDDICSQRGRKRCCRLYSAYEESKNRDSNFLILSVFFVSNGNLFNVYNSVWGLSFTIIFFIIVLIL